MSDRVKGLIAVPALMTVLLSSCASSKPTVNNNQRLERFTRPAVVMVASICKGQYTYTEGSKTLKANEDISSYGSGYFINSNGYIATNAHVTENATKEKCEDALFNKFFESKLADISKNKALARQKSKLQNFKAQSRVLLPNRPNKAPLPFEITKSGNPESKDVSIIHLEGKEGKNTPSLRLEKAEVQTTAPVLVFGYPADSFTVGVKTESALKPSVVEGTVSNTGLELKSGASVLQVSASVSPGNSGGPVINSDGKVIGMVAFRADEGNSSIFYAIPAKTIEEFSSVEIAKESSEQGQTDVLYQKGLENYWQQRYADAISQFEQVQALYPNHSEVEDLIQQSRAEDAKRRPNYLLLAAIAAIIAAIPALVFVLYRRGLIATGDGVVGSVVDRMTGIWQPTPVKQGERPHTIADYPPAVRPPAFGQPFIELETRSSSIPLQLHLGQDVHHIGRDAEWSDIEIPEQGWEIMSGRHAVLRREGASYRIFDGDGKPSTNGVWFDGKRIDPVKGFLLTNGVQLQFGQKLETQVTLTYCNPAEKPLPKPTYVE